jgi:transcriptional regulator with XRE-family HTH domain
MLAPYQIDLVRRLLVEKKLTQRQLARLTGVSRGTIAQIAAGRRPPTSPTRSQDADDFDVPLVPPERCPTCGGWVYPPCRLCHMRELLRKHGQIARLGPLEYPIIHGLDLKPRHRKRYQQVRRFRCAMEAAG